MPTGAIEYRVTPRDAWELAHHRTGSKADIFASAEGILREMVEDLGQKRAQVQIVWPTGRAQRVRLERKPAAKRAGASSAKDPEGQLFMNFS